MKYTSLGNFLGDQEQTKKVIDVERLRQHATRLENLLLSDPWTDPRSQNGTDLDLMKEVIAIRKNLKSSETKEDRNDAADIFINLQIVEIVEGLFDEPTTYKDQGLMWESQFIESLGEFFDFYKSQNWEPRKKVDEYPHIERYYRQSLQVRFPELQKSSKPSICDLESLTAAEYADFLFNCKRVMKKTINEESPLVPLYWETFCGLQEE